MRPAPRLMSRTLAAAMVLAAWGPAAAEAQSPYPKAPATIAFSLPKMLPDKGGCVFRPVDRASPVLSVTVLRKDGSKLKNSDIPEDERNLATGDVVIQMDGFVAVCSEKYGVILSPLQEPQAIWLELNDSNYLDPSGPVAKAIPGLLAACPK